MSIQNIGIELPLQHRPVPGDFDLNPEAVARFIRELPLAHAGETARALDRLLTETNHIAYEAEARLRFLSSLRPVLDELCKALARRIEGEQFPLSPRALLVAELMVKLHQGFALGYMIAAETLAARPRSPEEPLAFALLQALRRLSQALVTIYKARSEQGAGLWAACHRLYRFAESRGLTDYRPPNARRDIRSSYQQILLLACADPHRLRQAEVALLYDGLEPHAGLARLLPADTPPEAGAVLYMVDTEGAREPARRELFEERGALPAGSLLLRVDEVAAALAGEADPQFAPLAQQIGDYLQRPLTRANARMAMERPFELLFGLTAIHTALLADHPFREEQAALFGSARFTVWPKGHQGRVESDPLAASMQEQRVLTPLDLDRAAQTEIWLSRDLSTAGLRLARESQGAALHVGELVALREQATGTPHRLGVIRWFRQEREEFQIGIELLGSRPEPLAIRGTQGDPQRGLRLIAWRSHEQLLLLLPGLLFHKGQSVTVLDGVDEQVADLERVVEEMPDYALYGLEPEEEPPAAATEGTDPAAESAGGRFDALWRRL